jgi:hypothetical protein
MCSFNLRSHKSSSRNPFIEDAHDNFNLSHSPHRSKLYPFYFFSYFGNEVFTILFKPNWEMDFNSKHSFIDFNASKVPFHLKDECKVLVTTTSLIGNVVDLWGIWSTDFSKKHLRVAMACNVRTLGFLEPKFLWWPAFTPSVVSSAYKKNVARDREKLVREQGAGSRERGAGISSPNDLKF